MTDYLIAIKHEGSGSVYDQAYLDQAWYRFMSAGQENLAALAMRQHQQSAEDNFNYLKALENIP